METIPWKQPKLFSKHYVFGSALAPIARLTFTGTWSNDALYTSETTSYFLKMRSSFKNEVDILENGELIADVSMPDWGRYTLRMASGRWYTLVSDMFSNSYRWVSNAGEELIWYSQGLLEICNGTILLAANVPPEDRELLLCTGFYLKQYSDQTVVLLIIFFILFIVIF
ncbi:hypothetical protein POKO110462_13980 [Pontibacter korlensis]|uniref:Uncharacterized protein n=1 Tax=Pontibacter korlensis TaxID=400092 RepID=A0A0E3ZE02_9BACT|nr:hypothetical protein [Pontibacter korlensis]AKD02014.1 hypothetical protein PKOR_01240 [Pontibacter korlensis]